MTEELKEALLQTGAIGPSLVDEAPEAPAESDFADDANTSLDPTSTMAARRTSDNGSDEDETRPLTLPSLDLEIDSIRSDRRLLELAIQASPDPLFPGRHLPATRFATDIALCNDRTLRRYQEGSRALPNLLREKLRNLLHEAQKKAARKAARES